MAAIANSLLNLDTHGLVLCIDDDPDILELTKWKLEKHGYSVMTTQEWHYGLEIVKQTPIDIVILDYEMPGIRGHEVALWIRLAKPEVPIILYSGAVDIPKTAKTLMDACIQKGADYSLLLSAIADLIMKSRESLNQQQNA
jgi:DNA-binding NtrC family response regulator